MYPSKDVIEGQIIPRLREQVRDVFVCERVLADLGTNVTDQAARVIIQACAATDRAVERTGRGDGAEVDGHVCKGAGVDAAAAGARGNSNDEGGDARHDVGIWSMRDRETVARDGGCGAVKKGGAGGVLGIFGPVPIARAGKDQLRNGYLEGGGCRRLVALVAAFVAKGFFVGPGEVAVPGEELRLLC